VALPRKKHENDNQDQSENRWKFSDLVEDPQIGDRWEKVRKYFFLRESTYDMTNRCNIRCEGCYYYVGEKQFAGENRDPEAWRRLMQGEKSRGITYVVLAWGNDETSFKVRSAKNMLLKQIDNYKGDPRAVFVYTFTRENIDEIYEVMDVLAEHECRITFNMFSAPVGYEGPLRHTEESLMHTRKVIMKLISSHSENVLFSPYNVVAHTHSHGLHDLFTCSYPRMNPSTDIGLGRSFRQYRTDLTWDRDVACCVPDTDCHDCRHYAAGSAYLAVWVMGYEKGKNLCDYPVAPPGHDIF